MSIVMLLVGVPPTSTRRLESAKAKRLEALLDLLMTEGQLRVLEAERDDPRPPAWLTPAERKRILADPAAHFRPQISRVEKEVARLRSAAGANDRVAHAIDLGKTWDGLHVVLTGKVFGTAERSILGRSLAGGRPVGADRSYGPACLLAPAEVKKVSKALTKLPRRTVRARSAPAALQKAGTLHEWSADDSEQLIGSTLPRFCSFYEEAAAAGEAVLLYTF